MSVLYCVCLLNTLGDRTVLAPQGTNERQKHREACLRIAWTAGKEGIKLGFLRLE